MTTTQFYLGIAIPSILVILGWLHQNTRLTDLRGDMHRGFDQMAARLDRVDNRIDKVDIRLGRIDDDLRNFHGTDKELEGRVNELSARIK